jgi:hypothetical protein
MLYFMDTSYLVAITHKRDRYHADAVSIGRTLETPVRLLTTEAILMEYGYCTVLRKSENKVFQTQGGSMAETSEKNLYEQVFDMLDTFNAEQISQVLNFMESVRTKPAEKENPFLEAVIHEADSRVTLNQVREELSPIRGNLSDSIIEERERM